MTGLVYLVGAGPGDPGLITVKGLEAIKKADVIIYDRLANPQLLKHARPGAELIYVGKLPDRHTLKQEKINELIVEKAKEGKVVTRLKGGDPFIFGRGGEEAECCVEEGIAFEVVPGITSAIAVPAYAGIPVTHRSYNTSFTVVTGHECPKKIKSSVRWDKVTLASETLVFLMGVSNLPHIVSSLLEHGRSEDTPIALVRWGTRAEQCTIVGTLADIVQKVEEAGLRSPAVIVVGEVVKLRERLQWVEKKPLFGKRILVTRARSQNSALVEKIEALGGEAIEFPVIRITPPKRQDVFDDAVKQLDKYDWVIFTSVNGVDCFFKRLRELRIDIRTLAKARIGAVGAKTAEALLDRGLLVESLPGEYQQEALVEHLRPLVKAGQEILLPRANIARKVLPTELARMGCHVTEVDAYDTVADATEASEVVKLLQEGAIHVITFTSSSTVRNFLKAVRSVTEEAEALLASTKVVCIGPITAQTARELGVRVDATAETYTIDGLVETMKQL
jgi:uroporphyrinogen III methyltransferase / synthase